MAQYAPEQIEIIGQMIDLFTVDETTAMAGPGSVDRLVAKVREISTNPDFYDAKDLIDRWDFWVRYERSLADGHHAHAEAVAMMISDAGQTIGKPEDWSDVRPTTIAQVYLESAR